MPDWMALRRRASEQHLRLREALPPDAPTLLPADTLLTLAGESLGLPAQVLSVQDPVLQGANGMLDLESEMVWLSEALLPTRRRFILAHEYAHAWLHEGVGDVCHSQDAPEAFLPANYRAPSAQVAEGYSPKERREAEANVFAQEFLLPAPALRQAFLHEGATPADIASQVGVSIATVYSQLINAALLPAERAPQAESPTQTTAASLAQGVLFHVPPSAPPQLPQLDESQRLAAEIPHGPALVDAGPGTGKTRTLIGRLIYLIQTRRVPPENLVALTYTNKAAEEIRARLRAALGNRADNVWVGTFHAFGYEILRKEGHRIGLPLTPRLLETSSAVATLERHLDRLPLERFLTLHRPADPFPAILTCIARAKDNLQTPQDYLEAAYQQLAASQDDKERQRALKSIELAHLYRAYQEILAEERLLDFGDLLMRPVELFESHAEALRSWQSAYPHVLADEYQDVNRATARLLRLLSGEGRGFWAVGDLRQTIYRFQGASPLNVTEFERDFPQGKRLSLRVNYRSLTPLTRLFDSVAQRLELSAEDTAQAGDRWRAHRRGERPTSLLLAEPEDEAAQADGIAAQIRANLEAGTPLQEQAVLCPRNDQASEMAAALAARGIPTQHLGSLFDRPEIKDLLATLSVAGEPDGAMLARVARFPEYAIPLEDVTLLLEAAQTQEIPFPQALTLADEIEELSEEGKAGLRRLYAHIEPLLACDNAWLFLTRYLFEQSDYLAPLWATESLENQLRLLAVRQLLLFALGAVSRQYKRPQEEVAPLEEGSPSKEGRAFAQFLAYIRQLIVCHEDRTARSPEGAEELDAVRVMTIHSAKGLEFGAVYLPHLIEGQFPHRKPPSRALPPPVWKGQAKPEVGDSVECLYFVALTRARDQLVLSSPRHWRGKAAQPSSLLERTRDLFLANGAETVAWTTGEADAPRKMVYFRAESSAPPALLTETTTGLEAYWDCPRRYYYRRVARLPSNERGAAYLSFYRSLEETVRWGLAERAAGAVPSLESLQAKLATVWAEGTTDEPEPQQSLLRSRAEAALQQAYAQILDRQETLPGREWTANLPNGQLRVRADHVEERSDGGLRLVRHHRRPPREDDHTEERLAALRLAARQQNPNRSIEIELLYLMEGERVPVKEKAGWEARRVQKYDDALAAIGRGEFPPRPETEKCALCPFLFLCPQ